MDYDLGTDISVLRDLDDAETLVSDRDCLAQDVLLRLDNPQGLPDGTDEGDQWGFDLRSRLNAGLTPRALLELIVAVEVQVERDDRVLRASASASRYDPTSLTLYLNLTVETTGGPYALSIRCTADTLTLLEA